MKKRKLKTTTTEKDSTKVQKKRPSWLVSLIGAQEKSSLVLNNLNVENV